MDNYFETVTWQSYIILQSNKIETNYECKN